MISRVTFYYEQGNTASGYYTSPGTIACPYELSLGTRIHIANTGYGIEDGDTYICNDRYAENRLGWRFDIWLPYGYRLNKDYYEVEIED